MVFSGKFLTNGRGVTDLNRIAGIEIDDAMIFYVYAGYAVSGGGQDE